jgi:hypothetical protein
VRRKDMCWSMGIFLGSLIGRRIVTNGIRVDSHYFTGACGRSCAGMVCLASVGPEWSHSRAHALALDPRMWPTENVPGLGLIDEDVGLLRVGVCDILAKT